MRKNSVKNTRINGEVQRVLAETIRGEIKDPRISPWTSVVAVEVAPDLKSCKVWISVLGDEEIRKATLEGLRSAEGFMKRQLARTINLRNTPELTFVLDQSIEYGVNMSKKIDEVMAQDNENIQKRMADDAGLEVEALDVDAEPEAEIVDEE
ncbi:MAG: 30S ribosome-binding factor RbfA [Acetatifactor sp.]|nr:30S ribosome-binding factor RbfA [Acetatifactor sp.]